MTFPNIPNVTPTINLSREQVVNLLLASIAFEELGLAHVINAEGEKIQAAVGTLPGSGLAATTINELLAINGSVNDVLQTVVKKEMLLQFKLEDILDILTESTTSTTSTTTETTTTETTTTETTTTETTTTETTTTETTTTETTTTETTTTETTTETTTSETTTTETTTPVFRIVENIASASGVFNSVTYSDEANAFYNTTDSTVPGFSTSASILNSGNTDIVIGGVNLGQLPNYLMFFADGRDDANWQGASKGFVGDVAVDGIQANERTSGFVPYAGTIFTNDNTLDAWQNIVDDNSGQASGSTNQGALITTLENNLVNAIQNISSLPATPGFTSVSSASLDGLNFQNSVDELIVINVTSDFSISDKLEITGDPGDVIVIRWDEGGFDPTDGYQGEVKFQSGGAIVPLGGLKPSNFINVAGDIGSSGGGTNPAPPYPQGPRFNDGQGALITGGADFNGGGFFTGYWLTTGAPTIAGPGGLLIGPTGSLSNGIFVGGWYTLTTDFSMTSGTSGVYVSPNPATQNPNIQLVKEVSVDEGLTWQIAGTSPGPVLPPGVKPWYRFTVTNTGNVTLTNIVVTDNQIGGTIGVIPFLNPGGIYQIVAQGN